MKRIFILFFSIALLFGAVDVFASSDIIVDNGDSGYTDTSWTYNGSATTAYLGDISYAPSGSGSETATWTPNLPSDGQYNVYVSWTTLSNRATDAPYTVNYDGGSQIFYVNQELLSDQITVGGYKQWSDWYFLGTFDFSAGMSGSVELSNDADEYVMADAVRFEKVTIPGWDPTGVWSLEFDVSGTPYNHTMTVTSFDVATGEFSGTGTYDADNSYTWDVNGVVDGDNIDFTVVYTGTSAGYTFDATGTISPNGTLMSGTWDSGTWTGTGSATAVNIFVDDDFAECPNALFGDVQSAIDVAGVDSVITICDGTYNENLNINTEGIKLIGTNRKKVIINTPMSGSDTYGIAVNANNVLLKNMTVKNSSADNEDYNRFQIKVSHVSGFKTNKLRIIGNGKSNGYITGLDLNSVQDASIFNTVIKNYSKNGLAVTSRYNSADIPTYDLTIKNLRVENNGKSPGWAGIAFYTNGGGTGQGDITGIRFLGNNTIKGNPIGLYVEGDGGSVYGPSGSTLNLGNTKFENNSTQDIANSQSADIDALGSTFVGAVSGFDIEDRVLHAVDSPLFGLVSWESDTVYVTPNSFAPIFGTFAPSIQRGIDAVPGSTVNVGAGTYEEQLLITKDNLRLFGEGANATTLKQPSVLSDDTFGSKNLITVSGAVGVEISGFTFEGNGSGLDTGIYVQDGAELGFYDNEIKSIGSGGNNIGILVGRDANSTFGSATIRNNTISGYGKGGIVVDGIASGALVEGNTIIGGGPSQVAQNGIQISRGATGSVIGNTITDNICDNASAGCLDDPTSSFVADSATGVLLYFSGDSVEIIDNTVSGNQFNIWSVGADNVNIRNNQVTGTSGVGISVWDSDQWADYFGFIEVATEGVIEDNFIEGHDFGILIRDYVSGGELPEVEARNNLIISNGFGAWSNTPFNAEYNDWGDCKGPYHASLNPDGLGNQVSDNIDFEPWIGECPGSISGMKFEDVNGNGIRDIDTENPENSEPGIEGWVIRLKNIDTGEVIRTVTDENGEYEFTDIVSGSYRVWEKQRDGWTQTYPLNPNKYFVDLSPGEDVTDVDFGNFKNAQISGIKYEDMNGNGVFDFGESPLEGWEITIESEGISMTAITDINGKYVFEDLGPGEYLLTEETRNGWGQSQPGPIYGYSYTIEPKSDETMDSFNFGNYQFATIKGRKYRDKNLNGRRDRREPWLSGWTIRLINLQTGETLEDITNRRGRYGFTDLAPGDYIVQEILQNGWIPVNPSSSTHRLTIESDEVADNVNFGNATLYDKISNDMNINLNPFIGRRQAPPVAGPFSSNSNDEENFSLEQPTVNTNNSDAVSETEYNPETESGFPPSPVSEPDDFGISDMMEETSENIRKISDRIFGDMTRNNRFRSLR